MTGRHRIDKLERIFPSGETYVLFVIRTVGRLSSAARIANHIFEKHPDESEDALVDRALESYRKKCPPAQSVSALVVDCRA